MNADIKILPEVPFDDGLAAGRKTTRAGVLKEIDKTLKHPRLRDSLGGMSRRALETYTLSRLHTPPDFTRFPELEDIHPERVEFLRGFAKGAGCTLAQAAVRQYAAYRREIEEWSHSVAFDLIEDKHCSGVLMVGPDGVLGAHSAESTPPPKPRGYRHRTPKPYRGLKQVVAKPRPVVLRRPRTGYIQSWGITNEVGVGGVCGTSCTTHLDDPIEDTWPCDNVPLLRFARDVRRLEELFTRYTLHNWGRGSMIFGDTSGGGLAVEKSFRRVGFRRLGDARAIWCTEGHFESPEMSAFIRAKRLDYLARTGRHLGCGDMQYFTDAAVRFTHIGHLCHQEWGHGLEHMRKVVTDHAPFPRAVCRHCGPDTAAYDRTPTMMSNIYDLTHNRVYARNWKPWKTFCCEAPEHVTQCPPRPS